LQITDYRFSVPALIFIRVTFPVPGVKTESDYSGAGFFEKLFGCDYPIVFAKLAAFVLYPDKTRESRILVMNFLLVVFILCLLT
jgi:hypothetical protein